MCELIMAGEEGVRKRLKQKLDQYPDQEDSEDEDDLSHESYDLQLDMDFDIRYRSNTAARLEKLELVKKKNSRMTHVKWELSKTPMSQNEIDELFVRKEPKIIVPQKSLLSTRFKELSKLPSNPFIEYSRFDGSGQVNVPTKRYKIFVTMLPESQRNYPLHVCCLGSATILDLIGLILLKCSTKFDNITWKPPIHYGLYITEDDGEVDRDFPHLDHKENISKFGFTCLGLVEHSDLPKGVSFETTDALVMSKSFDNIYNRKTKEQLKLNQEKQISSDLQLMDIHNKAMEAPLYKSYKVYLVNKIKAKAEIHLGVSGEKIEIDPVAQNTKFALVKQKPVSQHMDSIAWCEIVELKANKAVFRVIYSHNFNNPDYTGSPLQTSTSFKSYEFEADQAIAEEIVNKIDLILQFRSSETRKEYIAAQERKHYKKKSFNLTK